MATHSQTRIYVSGYLVGSLWWPMGAEAWKDFSANLSDLEARFGEPTDLRTLLLHAVMAEEGDFCGSASIAQGELIAERTTRTDDGRRTTVERRWPLARFPSVADLCHPDADWWPMSYDDLEEAA